MKLMKHWTSFFFIITCAANLCNAKSTSRHARIDLHPRGDEWLHQRAKAMSKPYPHRGEPATWQEIVEQTGRTPQEIDDLHRHVESLGWKVQEVCKSMKCMYATIEVPEDGTVESIEDIAHDQLHRKLGERKSGGIVKAVRLLEKPATGNTTAEANHKASDLLRARSPFESHNMSRRLQSSSFPPQIVNSVYDITGLLREQVGLNRTLYDANFLQFLVVPVICNITSTTSNASALELESQGRDCDQNISFSFYQWTVESMLGPDIIPVGMNVTTSQLFKTMSCAEFAEAKPGMVCEDAPFNVNGDEYVLKIDGNTTFRYFEFSLLQDGIAYYTPSITYFPETEQALTFQYGDPSKGYYVGPTITPFYGNEMYNVPEGHRGSGLGCTAFVYGAPNGLNAYSKEALAAVNTAFGLPVPDIELYTTSMFTGMNYSMCYLPGQSCGESDLDVQMITQYGAGASFGFIPSDNLVSPQPSVYEAFVQYREAFMNANVTPDVLSLSWSQTDPDVYDESVDQITEEFAVAGITVIVATGDRGNAGDGGSCSPPEYTALIPNSPTMSSWVLTVGGVSEAYIGDENRVGPVAVMGPTSFSIASTGAIYTDEILPAPDYQIEAIQEYLNSEEYRNFPVKNVDYDEVKAGRGIPDVSAYAANIPITARLQDGSIAASVSGGTSASAPMFAGLLLQVKSALEEAPECEGQTITFGHINPFIYWAKQNRPESFTDITIGNNAYGGQTNELNVMFCGQGFPASKGWDPVTGNGMMNFPAFVDAAKEWYCMGVRSDAPTQPPTPQGTTGSTTGSTTGATVAAGQTSSASPTVSTVSVVATLCGIAMSVLL